MLHSSGREDQEKTGKERAKCSAVCDSIRGKWKAVGLEGPHANPGDTSCLSSSFLTPNGQSGLHNYDKNLCSSEDSRSLSATTSGKSCCWKGEQDMFQTKTGHSTRTKVVAKGKKKKKNQRSQDGK